MFGAMLKFGQIVANVIGINNMPFDGHSNEKKNLLFMNKMLKFVLRLVYLIWHGIIAYLFMKKIRIILMIKQVNRKLIVFIFISKYIHACTHIIQQSYIFIPAFMQNA